MVFMATQISINVDGIDVVLEGAEAEAFIAKQQQELKENEEQFNKFIEEKENMAANKQAAVNKLAALGLSEAEVKALFA